MSRRGDWSRASIQADRDRWEAKYGDPEVQPEECKPAGSCKCCGPAAAVEWPIEYGERVGTE